MKIPLQFIDDYEFMDFVGVSEYYAELLNMKSGKPYSKIPSTKELNIAKGMKQIYGKK